MGNLQDDILCNEIEFIKILYLTQRSQDLFNYVKYLGEVLHACLLSRER